MHTQTFSTGVVIFIYSVILTSADIYCINIMIKTIF